MKTDNIYSKPVKKLLEKTLPFLKNGDLCTGRGCDGDYLYYSKVAKPWKDCNEFIIQENPNGIKSLVKTIKQDLVK